MLIGLITTLVLAQLGLAIRQETRLSRMEGRLNGTMDKLMERMKAQDAKLGDHNESIKNLPCNQRGWQSQDCS